jgi:glutamate formiminotransferase / formiminotetrahydrofolate cyclodeaminase
MQKLIECVPNFSEGCDQNVIRQITGAIESVDGVSLLILAQAPTGLW